MSSEIHCKVHPKVNYLFQRPKREARKDGPYGTARKKFMTNISTDANLSQKYTNHSILATTITLLGGEGYEARHILTVSGHRSADSLRSYCWTNIGTKRKMSEALSRGIRNNDVAELRFSNRSFKFGVNLQSDPTCTRSSFATRYK